MKIFNFIFLFLFLLNGSVNQVNSLHFHSERNPAEYTKTGGLCRENLYFLLKTQTQKTQSLASSVGYEFEGAIPAQISYAQVADRIKMKLTHLYPNKNIVIEEQYSAYGASQFQVKIQNSQGDQIITVKKDISLSIADTNLKGIEITSPIMKSKNDYDNFMEVLNDLHSLYLKPRQDVGGVHLHFGIPKDKTVKDFLILYELFYKSYHSLKDYFKVNESRGFNNFKELEQAYEALRYISNKFPNKLLLESQIPELGKRSILRISDYLGTWEIRLFNSTLDPKIQNFYHDFSEKIFELWNLNDPGLYDFVKIHEKIDAKDLLNFLGFDVSYTNDLMRKLVIEGKELGNKDPLSISLSELFDDMSIPSFFSDKDAALFYEIALSDRKFTRLPVDIQETILAHANELKTQSISLSETLLHYQKWQDFDQIESIVDTLDLKAADHKKLFDIFYLFFEKRPDMYLETFEKLSLDKQGVLYKNILDDYIKYVSFSSTNQFRNEVTPPFFEILLRANSILPADYLARQNIEIMSLIATDSKIQKADLNKLAKNTLFFISLNPKSSYDYAALLKSVKRLEIELATEEKKQLIESMKDNLHYDILSKTFENYLTFVFEASSELLDLREAKFILKHIAETTPKMNSSTKRKFLNIFNKQLKNMSNSEEREALAKAYAVLKE